MEMIQRFQSGFSVHVVPSGSAGTTAGTYFVVVVVVEVTDRLAEG
jgi:hypothetical protein